MAKNCCDECTNTGTGSANCNKMKRYNSSKLKSTIMILCQTATCDLPQFLREFIHHLTCLLDNIINNICAIWGEIDKLHAKDKDLQDQINDLDDRVDALEKCCNDVKNELDDIWDAINQIQTSVTVNGKIEVPREIDVSNNHQLIHPVSLGNVTASTRVGITWSEGSTRRTDYYTVGELRTNTAHILGENHTDNGHSSWCFEVFTKIKNSNQLWITTLHSYRLGSGGDIVWVGKSWDSNGNVYYNTQNPDYTAQNEGQDHIYIQRVVVYDLIDPVNVN